MNELHFEIEPAARAPSEPPTKRQARSHLLVRTSLVAAAALAVTTALAGAPIAIARSRTVGVTAQVVWRDRSYTDNGLTRCAEVAFLQIGGVPGATSYTGSVDDAQLGHRTFTGPPFDGDTAFHPGYGGITYSPPAGDHAWSLTGAVGPGGCDNMPGRFSNPQARATIVTSCTAGAAIAASTTGTSCCRHDCPMRLAVQLAGSPEVGLSLDRGEHPPKAAFASSVKRTQQGAARCLSGCRNVEIRVTDRHGAAIRGARITLSVSAFPAAAIFRYPGGASSDAGHLCRATAFSVCGDPVKVRTNYEGDASLLYWMPGTVRTHKVELTLTASAKGYRTATAHRSLTVSAHLIYGATGYLSLDDSDLMLRWARRPYFLTPQDVAITLAGGDPISNVIDAALKELAGEFGPRAASLLSLVANYYAAQAQAKAVAATLFLAPLHLFPDGIGAPDALGFDQHLADRIASRGQLLDSYAKRLLKLEKTQGISPGRQELRVRIYEVSYCERSNPCLGRHTNGTHPFLYFVFEGGEPADVRSEDGTSYPLFTDAFTLPYNASEWLPYQPGLR